MGKKWNFIGTNSIEVEAVYSKYTTPIERHRLQKEKYMKSLHDILKIQRMPIVKPPKQKDIALTEDDDE